MFFWSIIPRRGRFGNGELLEGRFFPQHQTSTSLSETCGGNRATPAFPCSLARSPTSTPKPRAEGRVRASGTQVTSRPERSGDQVLLPLPIHLSPGLAKTAWPGAFSSLCDPGHGLSIPSSCCIRCCPLTSARNRFLPPFSPPAPKTHPVSPFSGFSGCVSPFLSSFDLQNLRAGFCATCA